jgi:allantoinase
MPDLVIRGGDVVLPSGMIRADIAVDGEYITEVGQELSGGKAEFDARGLTVLPGLIDVHVHFNEPGRTDWEGGKTGSSALAAGGGSMFIDMPLNSSPCTLDAASFDQKRAALESSSITEFGLYGGIVPGNTQHLEELAERGVMGFKAFLCNSGLPEFPRADDETLYAAMREATRLDLPVLVHAENEEMTAGSGQGGIRDFLDSRPVAAEVEAITRAGKIARETGCRLHVVHISSGSGVTAALEARASGTNISLETCPHYLYFTESDMIRLGAIAKCAPPLRGQDEYSALREEFTRGAIDIVGSDHSPCSPTLKGYANFFQVWGGIAGVQSTLSALLTVGTSPEKIAAVTAAHGAQRFRIPNKGVIAPGMHADFALIDVGAEAILKPEALLQTHKVSPYMGEKLRGAVRATFRRGEQICSDGVITAKTKGRFVRPSKGS